MKPCIAALFNAQHRAHVESEQVQAERRVGLMVARRAMENGRDPIEARETAQRMLRDGAHGGLLGPIIDEVAGPLNRTEFAQWMVKRAAERAARRAAPC